MLKKEAWIIKKTKAQTSKIQGALSTNSALQVYDVDVGYENRYIQASLHQLTSSELFQLDHILRKNSKTSNKKKYNTVLHLQLYDVKNCVISAVAAGQLRRIRLCKQKCLNSFIADWKSQIWSIWSFAEIRLVVTMRMLPLYSFRACLSSSLSICIQVVGLARPEPEHYFRSARRRPGPARHLKESWIWLSICLEVKPHLARAARTSADSAGKAFQTASSGVWRLPPSTSRLEIAQKF